MWRQADDVLQILYTRWWQRMRREPAWRPPEDRAALFVSVKRVVLDEVSKERRLREGANRSAVEHRPELCPADESLHAMSRLAWILERMPSHLAEVLQASLTAGRRRDDEVARELGLTSRAFTARLFKARRAAEKLAADYDVVGPDAEGSIAGIRRTMGGAR